MTEKNLQILYYNVHACQDCSFKPKCKLKRYSQKCALYSLRYRIWRSLKKFNCKFRQSCLNTLEIPKPDYCSRCWIKSKIYDKSIFGENNRRYLEGLQNES